MTLKVVRAGQTWFVKLPGESSVTCIEIDEVTPKTVAFRVQADLGNIVLGNASRYARADLVFLERVP